MLIVACMISAPADKWFYGDVPESVATFKIAFSNDATEYYGGVMADGQWVQDSVALGQSMKRIEIVIDTPWAPQPSIRELRNKVQLDYEAPVLRKQRLQQGWDAAGYEFLDTADGRHPVRRQELELARRAREMAAVVEHQVRPPQFSEDSPDAADATPVQTMGKLREWGGHALLLVLGLGMLAIIVKTLILSEE